jgi:hypothetical protein
MRVESCAFDSLAQLRRSRASGHPKGRSEAEEPSGLTTRSVEAIPQRDLGEGRSRTFCDWQRYRSAFNEAIGLPAMSEHLPGVTMNGAAGRLV